MVRATRPLLADKTSCYDRSRLETGTREESSMTYSFVGTVAVRSGRGGLTPEQRKVYTRIPRSISHVPHASFEHPDTEADLFGAAAPRFNIPQWTQFPEVPQEAAQPQAIRETLTKEQEASLFLRYNYARYRLGVLTAKQLKTFSLRRSHEMVRWYIRVQEIRCWLVHANMALVMAMARRTCIPHVEFAELISEGNVALLRAIEGFDVSRGFKFSTYACRAILKAFNRLATRTGRYVSRFPVEFNSDLDRGDCDVLKHQIQQENAIADLEDVLATNRANLSRVERIVITERFALVSRDKKKTLNEVGEQIGLTNERVRQIQKKALAKLKTALNEEYLVA